MKKVGTIAGGMVLGLLLLGAGCADQTANQPMEKDADTSTIELNTEPATTINSTEVDTSTTGNTTMQPSEGMAIITLKGEAIGDGKVNFTWTTVEKMDESNKLILVRSDKENPEHTGKNHWMRMYYAKTDSMCGDQPTGTWHYRICITAKTSSDTCMFYSNDIQVDVK